MKNVNVGDIFTSDYQSDIYEGQYRLVEDQGNGNWVAEYVEPNDELIERVRVDMFSEHAYLGYHDPFGPERRIATPQEAFDKEICDRIDRAGRRFELRFVSSATYAAMF